MPRTTHGGGLTAESATDFDLADAFPCSTYTIENILYYSSAVGYQSVLSRVCAVYDDGHRVTLDIGYNRGLAHEGTERGRETYTTLDDQGRVASVFQNNLSSGIGTPFDVWFAFRARHVTYDAATGRGDEIYTLHHDGRQEAIDDDVAPNNRDFAVTTYADGRIVSHYRNAANGMLDYRRLVEGNGHTLDQAFDSAGRLDYAVERWAAGRMLVTDYDAAGDMPWATYSILHGPSGQIENVTVL